MIVILMGVAGSGKTTIGQALAAATGWEFSDADWFHSEAAKEKMSRGEPLTRKTERPSAEKMLLAFCNLTLYFLPNSTIFITPLSELQKQILWLMKMPESFYQVDSMSSST